MRRSARHWLWASAVLVACGGGDAASSGDTGVDAGVQGGADGSVPSPPPPSSDAGPAAAQRAIGGAAQGVHGAVVLKEATSAQSITVVADGAFVFPARVPEGAAYAVSIEQQPPGLTCALAHASGTASGADVTEIALTCAEQVFTVGGSVTGLAGAVTLVNNGGDAIDVSADGPFTFPTALPDGAPYEVTIAAHPSTQRCSVTKGAGEVSGKAVSDVEITCAAAYTVGGTVSGLTDGAVVLQLNGEAGPGTVFVDADGAFTFPLRVAPGAPYAVTVLRSPPGQTCSVAAGAGTMPASDTSPAVVTCRKLAVTIDEVYARVAAAPYGDANGDGVLSGAQDEFVEIVNTETFAVDVGSWSIWTGATPARRRVFPPGTMLPPGGRLVLFGGGVPTGSFGGAPTFTASLGLTDAPAAPATVTIEVRAENALLLDSYTYDGTTFTCSPTTTCGSQVRSPAGTGAFVAHATVSGSAGILWSPGVAATAAIPKLGKGFSYPLDDAVSVSVKAQLKAQFNMWMTPADLAAPHVRLFASPCAAPANEVASLTYGAGADDSVVRLLPTADLAFDTVYCLDAAADLRSANGTTVAGRDSIEFRTRPAASAPAASVVISEVGGCRFASSAGNGCTANDEFVELHNPTDAALPIGGYFLQRRTAGGSRSCWATLPADAAIPAHGYFLVGGRGYNATKYDGSPVADHQEVTAGTTLTGANESVVLLSSDATSCTANTVATVVDAVSFGAVTETFAGLQLPALDVTVADGTSIERKACYDSATGAGPKGMATGGGHAGDGNGERIGASNADWTARATPQPQNTTSTAEPRGCL